MAENKIELKSVKELLGMKFFIPSYQRGYRWTEQQVKDLLNDVSSFKPMKDELGNESWYCLQPLVLANMEDERKKDYNLPNDKWFEVIDGQQRLTTIFIILKLLDDKFNSFGDNSFSLKYQTRPKSEVFLEKIKEEKDDSNIDYHYMLKTKKTILDWKGDRNDLVIKLKNHCKMIWYETGENAYNVFKRLNSGKISLSNAELVKALLLKDDNFEDLDDNSLYLKQLEMAGEWDRMEQVFHDNCFWYFINPEPEDARFNCTRIDFLLELILRCDKSNKLNTNDFDFLMKQNDFLIFSEYSQKIANDGWEKIWRKIQNTFRTIKSWYDDREKYHYIGYLMNLKGKDKQQSLIELLQNSKLPKDKFLSHLKEKCRNTLKYNEKKECYFQDWEYGKNNDEIHNILLLFNLATTQNQISEMSRYPFDKHFEQAKHKWSLEHIHAQNEKNANWNKEELSKIKKYLSQISVEGIEALIDYLKDKETSDNIDENAYRAIIGAFMGCKVNYDNNHKPLGSDFEKDDHLTNMALLQGDKNAAFNNKTYPEKREKLAEYENVEKEALFVPICTRNVFFKHYSPLSSNPFVWDEDAELEYVTAIVKVVAAYLDLKPILPDDNKEKYGVKIKEDKI